MFSVRTIAVRVRTHSRRPNLGVCTVGGCVRTQPLGVAQDTADRRAATFELARDTTGIPLVDIAVCENCGDSAAIAPPAGILFADQCCQHVEVGAFVRRLFGGGVLDGLGGGWLWSR
ncbi:hypothetical protein ATM97_29330 [Nocardia sp. MH4]|nr:hypothetical protein [Nocardia sp. MH4]